MKLKRKDYTITYLTLTNLTINSTRDCAWPTRIWWNDLETTSAEMSGSCQSLEKLLYYVFLLSSISSIWVQGVRWRRLIYECWMVYCLNRIGFAELHIFVYSRNKNVIQDWYLMLFVPNQGLLNLVVLVLTHNEAFMYTTFNSPDES